MKAKTQIIRLAVLIGVGAVVLGGTLVYRGQRAAGQLAVIREPASQLVRSSDVYRSEAEFVDWLFEVAHPKAVAAVGSAFSESKYYTALFQSMVDAARENGREEVGRSLRTFAVGKGYVDVKY